MNLRNMIIEAYLAEAPYLADWEPEEIDAFAKRGMKSAIENAVAVRKSNEHHIVTSKTGTQAHYHKKEGVPARSISIFTQEKELGGVVHSYTSKRDGSSDEIIQNIKEARKEHKKVWSDSDQTPGAVKLWRKLSSLHPKRVHVMHIDSFGRANDKGLLAEHPDSDVWGYSGVHAKTRLLFK